MPRITLVASGLAVMATGSQGVRAQNDGGSARFILDVNGYIQ